VGSWRKVLLYFSKKLNPLARGSGSLKTAAYVGTTDLLGARQVSLGGLGTLASAEFVF